MINEKSSATKPALVFIILLVIIMALGAIVYLTMFKNPSPIAVQPTASPKTTTMPDIDIADWQIYRNEKYGFEVKYPQDFEGEEPESGDVLFDVLLGAEKTEGGISYYLTIKVRPNYKVDQIVSSVKDAEKITIGDHPGYKYFYTEGIGESGVALIQIGQDELSIIFDSIGNGQNFANAGDRKIYVQNMLDQILSTLKFTEKNETADWKVYRNEEYGFEFEYKSDWQLEQQDNYIELKPIINDKPEEISISVNIITNRPKDYTLAGWLLQNGNNNASCDFVKKVDKIEWCGVNSERFEAVRADDYGVTKNGIDYDIQFRVAYGRQEMDKYISDKELSGEIDVLNQILSTFKFIEKDETVGWNVYRNEEYGYEVKYPKDWVYKEYNNAIYFGTPESKSGGYIWGISVQQPNELEKLISQTGNQFDDRKEIREKAMIDKNISGILITVTTNKHDDWISKKIYFEKNGKLFVIENGSIVDDRFKAFYNSFEFVNE